MSWPLLLLLAAGCYATKALGYALPARWLEIGPLPRVATLLTPTLVCALVAVNTLGDGRSLVLDARLPGVAAGALLAWRGAPLIVVVVVASLVTAVLRAL